MNTYDPWTLLQIAESCDPPEHIPDDIPTPVNEWPNKRFTAPNGWTVIFFYDAGELDYIDSFITPDGEVIDPWDYLNNKPEPWQQILMKWRSVGDLARFIKLEEERGKYEN